MRPLTHNERQALLRRPLLSLGVTRVPPHPHAGTLVEREFNGNGRVRAKAVLGRDVETSTERLERELETLVRESEG